MRIIYLFISVSVLMILSCQNSSSLEAVAGIEGSIEFEGSMPDSIKAVALVVLRPEALNDQENLGEYLVHYSDPIVRAGDYYIELKPDTYMGVLVGLLVDPGIFAVNVDTYLSSGDLPIVQLSQGANAFAIRKKEILQRDWVAPFNP